MILHMPSGNEIRIPVSQCRPVFKGGHSQIYPTAVSLQVPSSPHIALEQWLIAVSGEMTKKLSCYLKFKYRSTNKMRHLTKK